MAWVADTCLLIDVAENDPTFGVASARLLENKRTEGLTVCPMTYVELSPVFGGDRTAQDEFLFNLGVAWREPWSEVDTLVAHRAWNDYVANRRLAKIRKRPLADVLIGAFTARFDGLLTRNADDFRPLFPTLRIVTP